MNHIQFWEREKELRNNHLNPELVRDCMREIKKIASHRNPEYQLPADSFIEFHVREVLLLAEAQFKKEQDENKTDR